MTASVAQTFFTQPLTFTATIGFTVGNASMPSRSVTFMDGSNVLDITNANGGSATYTTSTLAAGTHTITVLYSGDTNFSPSTATAISQSVQPAVTSTAVSSSGNPTVIGQTVVFTATVTVASPSTGLAPGIVTFLDSGATLAIGALNGGTATFTTTSLALGDHAITVLYNGGSNYSSSSSVVLTQTVNQASTATSVIASSNPGIFGQWVTFTATVAVIAPGSDMPTGSVTFQFGGALTAATVPLSGDQATYATNSLSWGFAAVKAVYSGDGNNLASSSPPLTQTTLQTSLTTLTALSNPSVSGQSVILTATVTGGFSTPTGTVTFLDGTSLLGTATLNTSGLATYACTGLTHAGSPYTLTAVYGGDRASMGSTSAPLTQTVNQSSSNIVLTSWGTSSALNQPVVFTATVAVNPPGQGMPTGTVTLLDGTTPLGTALLSGGKASLTASSMALGGQPLTASYGGDANTAGSTSATVTQMVTANVVNSGILTIYGTPKNDTFSAAAATGQYTLNGTTYTFNPTGVTQVRFLGNGGTDTAYLTGTSGAETVTLKPRSGQLAGTGYTVAVSGVTNIVVNGGGGSDSAYLYDAAGSNTFVGTSTYSYLTGTGYLNEAAGFKAVVAYHTAGNSDVAYLYDAAGSNTFVGTSTYSYLTGTGYHERGGRLQDGRRLQPTPAAATTLTCTTVPAAILSSARPRTAI